MSKIDRAVHGPSWAEVILGAVLSLLLGAILAAAVLVIREPVKVKELPKPEDQKRNTVYFVEGSKDTSRARQAAEKRKAFVAGQTVTLTEEEINTLLAGDSQAAAAAQAKAGAPKAGDKKDAKNAEPAPAESGETVAVGAPNVRIRDGVVQVAAPVTLSALGVSQKVTFQSRGGFAKEGEVFVYQPTEMYVGSCPVSRLPVVAGLVKSRILAAKAVPEDIATAWRKLKEVVVEENKIRLTP